MRMGKIVKILIIIFLILTAVDTVRYFKNQWTTRRAMESAASRPQAQAAAQPVDNTPTVQAIPDVVITQSGKLILQKDTAMADIWNIAQIADMVPQVPSVWAGDWKDNGSEVSDWSAKAYVPDLDFQHTTLLRIRYYFEVTTPGDYVVTATTQRGRCNNLSASIRINDQRVAMSIDGDVDTGYVKLGTKGFYRAEILFVEQSDSFGAPRGSFGFKVKAPGDTQPHTVSHADMYWPIEPTGENKTKKEAL